MFWLKLKAGALQLTIFIIVIIAVLLTAFILLVHTHKQFQIQSDFIVETTSQSNSGIEYVLHNSIRLNDTTIVNLNDEDYKKLKVHRGFWGVFEKVTSVSRIKNKRFEKIALIGSKQMDNYRTALYVQDNNKPLVLVGDTKIEGVAYVPKQGVRPGYISGQSYFGSKLIYGQTRASSILPKIFPETINQIKLLEHQLSKIHQSQFLNIENDEQYANSFAKPLKMVFSNNRIDLMKIELTGHIVVQSKSKIVVHASSKLKDIVLIAPEIEIRNNVVGNFQAISSKQINVGSNVMLNYPSALLLNEKEEIQEQDNLSVAVDQNRITINDNSTVKGLVLFLGKENQNNYKVQIELKEKATIYGELYCNQNTELKGTVYGTVYTNNFIANQSGSVYQNHIYNGTIIIDELPKEYVGMPFINSKKEVLKWLY
jgi:hypothetical protein